jgi:curved DNA-binding protein CbpA
MTHDEAAAVLGVAMDADADKVRAAHKKLITQIHPDKGGTDYLAAKINEARDVMLARRPRS